MTKLLTETKHSTARYLVMTTSSGQKKLRTASMKNYKYAHALVYYSIKTDGRIRNATIHGYQKRYNPEKYYVSVA